MYWPRCARPPTSTALPERMDDALTATRACRSASPRPTARRCSRRAGAVFPEAAHQWRADGTSPEMPRARVMGARRTRLPRLRDRCPDGSCRSLPHAVVAVALDIAEHHVFMAVFYEILWLAIAAGILSIGLLGWIAARRGLAPGSRDDRRRAEHHGQPAHDRLPMAGVPTELVDLAAAFNDMLSRLEDSFRRLSEFSSDLAHELRTPIGNLMTQTQVALSRTRSAEEYREVLYSNSEEFERLARMIADMLFLAKADNGLIVPRSEDGRSGERGAGTVRVLRRAGGGRGRRPGARSAKERVTGDRLMIRRAISNLLSNAINHTPRGGARQRAHRARDDAGRPGCPWKTRARALRPSTCRAFSTGSIASTRRGSDRPTAPGSASPSPSRSSPRTTEPCAPFPRTA